MKVRVDICDENLLTKDFLKDIEANGNIRTVVDVFGDRIITIERLDGDYPWSVADSVAYGSVVLVDVPEITLPQELFDLS